MTRAITVFALIQTFLVIVGFCVLGSVLKVWGYPAEFDHVGRQWAPLALFLRRHGLWLLLLPSLWVGFATLAERRGRGIFTQKIALISGLAIAAVPLALFTYASLFHYSRF